MDIIPLVTAIQATRDAKEPAAVPYEIGSVAVWQNAAPPRYVWVLQNISYSAVQQPGKTIPSRQLHTADYNFNVHCWGTTFSEAESLVQQLIRAIHATAYGQYLLGGCELLNAKEGQSIQLGFMFVQAITLEQPVLDYQRTAVTITSVDIDDTGALVDGVLEAGEGIP